MPKYSRVEKVSRDLEDLKWEQNERAKFGVQKREDKDDGKWKIRNNENLE